MTDRGVSLLRLLLWRDVQRFKTKARQDSCEIYIRTNYPAAIGAPTESVNNPAVVTGDLAVCNAEEAEKVEDDVEEKETRNLSDLFATEDPFMAFTNC